MNRGAYALLLSVVALTIASCSTPSKPPSAPTTEPSLLPPRPHEVSIIDLDPCTALTDQQRTELELGRSRAFASPTPDRGPSCTWVFTTKTDYWAISLETSPRRGAAEAFGGPRPARTTEIAGYPAVETSNPLSPEDKQCFVIIDVAVGQALVIDFTANGSHDPMSHALACNRARLAGEQIMHTLLQR